MIAKLLFAWGLLAATLGPTSARFVEIPYEQFVANMLDGINRIPSMKSLNDDQKYEARGNAGLLFYAFICRGPTKNAQEKLSSLVSYMPNFLSPTDEATIATLGLLMIQGTSHSLEGATCRFAKGLAGI